ncbi:MAG: hypothetical protein IPN72_25115 [Saprospiraceae bacterium]|nr:hypothetical protein [Saprospiraceae bacterium]
MKFHKDKIAAFFETGQTNISGELTNLKVYYFNSKLLQYIKFYPLVQILLIGSYMGLGYFLFNSSRKAEQNEVWEGMAKETGHNWVRLFLPMEYGSIGGKDDKTCRDCGEVL